MLTTINNADQLRDAFYKCGHGEQFSHKAIELIFGYIQIPHLTEPLPHVSPIEKGEGYKLNVIKLCSEFSEKKITDLADKYDTEVNLNSDEQILNLLSKIRRYTHAGLTTDDQILVRKGVTEKTKRFLMDYEKQIAQR